MPPPPPRPTLFPYTTLFRSEPVALLESRPQPPIAHDHGIDYAIAIKGKLVLAQHTQLFRTDDSSLLRFFLAGQQLHKCGFAGAVRPSQAIALAGRKAGGDFVKQNFSAEAHGHVAN